MEQNKDYDAMTTKELLFATAKGDVKAMGLISCAIKNSAFPVTSAGRFDAFRWMEAAAARGEINAQFAMGNLDLHFARQVQRGKQEYYLAALRWLERAHFYGIPEAKTMFTEALAEYEKNFGVSYESGPYILIENTAPDPWEWIHAAAVEELRRRGVEVPALSKEEAVKRKKSRASALLMAENMVFQARKKEDLKRKEEEMQLLREEVRRKEEERRKEKERERAMAQFIHVEREKRFKREEKAVAKRRRRERGRKFWSIIGMLLLFGTIIGHGIFVAVTETGMEPPSDAIWEVILYFLAEYFLAFLIPICWITLAVMGLGLILWACLRRELPYDPNLHPDIREQSCKNCSYCEDHYINTVTTTYENGVEKSSSVTDVKHDHYECRHPEIQMVVEGGNACKHFFHFVDAEILAEAKKQKEKTEQREKERLQREKAEQEQNERLRKAGFRK